MVGLAAKAVIEEVCSHNTGNSSQHHPQRMTPYKFFGYQDAYHEEFEPFVLNDIDPEQWQAGKKQRHHCTVYGTCHRSGNSQAVPVNFEKSIRHDLTVCFATVLQM
jgi:hypothetical protein